MNQRQKNKDILLCIMDGMAGNYSALKRKLNKYNPAILSDIQNNWSFSFEASFMEQVYYYLNEETPVCKEGNRKKFEYFSTGYKSCKKGCVCAMNKHKETMLKNHGVEHPLQSDLIKEKVADRLQQKFGTSNLHLINEIKKKETNNTKYGCDYPLQSKEILNKTRQTYKEKTGFDSVFQNHNIQTQIQAHWLKKTGRRTYIKTKEQEQQIHENSLKSNFPEHFNVLTNKDKLSNMLTYMSRNELASLIGCSTSLIDKRIKEWNLTDFMNKPSYYECIIENFLNTYHINFEKNTRKIIPPKEIDFFLPDYNIAIEFNGLFWHGEVLGKKNSTYHLDKTSQCEQKGIRLIHIFQDEFDNNSEVIKSIILNACGKSRRIAGRKCSIKPISLNEERHFLDKYHLQGAIKGNFARYGLFHHDELVSVMTFKKVYNRIEISRYAVIPYTTILGGAQKLFKRFIIDYNPDEVYSYCDLRYFNGKIYESLGFKEVNRTKPNYWYFKKANKRHHRLNFVKKSLVKEGFSDSLTEWEIMKLKGYDRIWDCGNILFKWMS